LQDPCGLPTDSPKAQTERKPDELTLRDAIFARRAEELAESSAAESQNTEALEALVFELGRELYALPANQVHEVRPLTLLTNLPGTPAFLASVSLGDAFTAAVNTFIQNPDKTSKLPGASYYMFFTGLMFVTAILFIVVAYFYKERTFLQDERGDASSVDA